MASKIDVSGLTLSQEEASDLGKAVFAQEYKNGALAEVHEIHTGIAHDEQIAFVGKLSDTLKASSACGTNEGGTVAITDKTWNPKKMDTRLSHCAGDLSNGLKLFEKAKRINPDFYNAIDRDEIGVLAAAAGTMLRETLPEKIWFSDTAADDVDGSGVFTSGHDLDLHNVFDGMFKQIFAGITAGSDYHVDILANASASYALQVSDFSADKAFDAFESMMAAADDRLIGDDDLKLYCTRSMADNYRASIRAKGLSNGFIEIVEGRRPQLFFDGVPIVVMGFWDRFIKANQDNGTKYNNPHRAVLTTPANIAIGTLSEDDFDEIDAFYDKTDKKSYLDIALSLDAKFLETYMAVAAY